MAKPFRSPLVGYNHNLSHLGRVFHVQTEDSGPAAPRLFTHLFFEGTILASRKHEYDAALPDERVRALMQAQHKMVLRDLMQAKFDERIIAFFAARGEDLTPLVPGAVPAAPLPESSLPVMVLPPGPSPASGGAPVVAAPAPPPPAPPDVPAPMAVAPSSRIEPPVPTAPEREASGGVPARPGPRRTSTRPIETSRRASGTSPAPVVARPADGRRPPFVRSGTAPVTKISSADGVVVQRSVVVGDPSAPSRPSRIRPPVPYVVTGGGHTERPPRPDPQPPAPSSGPVQTAMPAPSEPQRTTTGFGVAVKDDKSLDEVILEYLSEDGD